MKRISAIIVAAGNSTRMGGINKQFALLDEIPVIARTLLAFEKSCHIFEIIVSTRESDIDKINQIAKQFSISVHARSAYLVSPVII